ncbi:MAG: ThuA domain-containing protein [Verrucomicrobia bacterium]|nr:ThuA domain-containing protein [Verrucomicrobiota bacterium]MBI3870345.1 ThuA domain-containing protein [Verrucomicrobiota bacterium]
MKLPFLFAACLIGSLSAGLCGSAPIRVLVWDEQQPQQKTAYGDRFLGETIADFLRQRPGLVVRATSMNSPGQGLEPASLDQADVLIWWGHLRHQEVLDANAELVARRVMDGKLALIALHSAHWAKPFVRLMQERSKSDALAQIPRSQRATARWEFTNAQPIGRGVKPDTALTPSLTALGDGAWRVVLPQCVFPSWRADGEPGRMTTLAPRHPIAVGLPKHWDVKHTEMYNEPFHVPPPDLVVFEEKWDKGEHFRSGCVWKVGRGRVFYFRPGHETFPVYQQREPLQVLENAARWLGKK